ncbi:MAG: hypothetical protein ACRC42_01975 [Mycoplasma sp.]
MSWNCDLNEMKFFTFEIMNTIDMLGTFKNGIIGTFNNVIIGFNNLLKMLNWSRLIVLSTAIAFAGFVILDKLDNVKQN